ncbi:hypothetical protein, partial [Escherichia coli]|uniref:hypothetical protein n=1 Tax=Escherichia coli TaxID=562 RepID=UPI001FCEC746
SGEKRVFLVILFTSFSGSLVSRIPGAVQFGSAKHPDCRGITVDELQKIQFDRLDFTNFYEDLMNNQKIPDSGVLTQKVKEQIADQLKQAGQ